MGEYLRRLRVEFAARQLASSELPLVEVALDAKTTSALAVAMPWRTTQLFGPTSAVADFSDPQRLTNFGAPFPAAFYKEILLSAVATKDHLEMHALLEELRFETLSFSVCAPSPRPAHATVGFTHRFAVRSGITLSATPRQASGCVDYKATMSASYQSAAPARTNRVWPWAEINQQASEESGSSLDVRVRINDALRNRGITSDVPALHEDHPPVIDQYVPLVPRADAALDAPSAIVNGADDQPYPFYGRVRVYWQ